MLRLFLYNFLKRKEGEIKYGKNLQKDVRRIRFANEKFSPLLAS
jgi:hypothetical protein